LDANRPLGGEGVEPLTVERSGDGLEIAGAANPAIGSGCFGEGAGERVRIRSGGGTAIDGLHGSGQCLEVQVVVLERWDQRAAAGLEDRLSIASRKRSPDLGESLPADPDVEALSGELRVANQHGRRCQL
jgi:hypothetical protein